MSPLRAEGSRAWLYSGGHLRSYGKNVSFCLSLTNDITETNKGPLKSSIKMLPEMKKNFFGFYKICWFLGHFLKKQCFLKMSIAGIKQWPCPSIILSFLVNLNEEALLKVSFKNIDRFQICPLSKTTAFSKKGPKNQPILKTQNFFAFLVANLQGCSIVYNCLFSYSQWFVPTQRETSQFYCHKISIGHHSTKLRSI